MSILAQTDGNSGVFIWICVAAFICGAIASPYIMKIINRIRGKETPDG